MPTSGDQSTPTWGKGSKRERFTDDTIETPKKVLKQDEDNGVATDVSTPVAGSSIGKKMNGKNAIDEFEVDYMPNGAWVKKSGGRDENNQTKEVHVCTTFLPSGLSIKCHAMTNAIAISCYGLSRIKVLFKGEDTSAGPPRMSVKEIDVDDYSHEDDLELQSVYLNTPWPCKIVEIMVIKRSRPFVTICEVQCFSSNIRSSSQSTPASKQLQPAPSRGKGQIVMKGVKTMSYK